MSGSSSRAAMIFGMGPIICKSVPLGTLSSGQRVQGEDGPGGRGGEDQGEEPGKGRRRLPVPADDPDEAPGRDRDAEDEKEEGRKCRHRPSPAPPSGGQ